MSTAAVPRQRKEKLRGDLEKLTECEHEQIYKIVREYTDQYTCSETGVFVSADTLPVECIDKIEKYIGFCFAQKQRLDDDEAKRQALYNMVHNS